MNIKLSRLKDETEYLNSSIANKKALKESMIQLNQGKGKVIKTKDLWT